jgi:hypothetical protein
VKNFVKMAAKVAVAAVAAATAITMWSGGVAHADSTWGDITPFSGRQSTFIFGNPRMCVALNAGDGYFNNNTMLFEWECNGKQRSAMVAAFLRECPWRECSLPGHQPDEPQVHGDEEREYGQRDPGGPELALVSLRQHLGHQMQLQLRTRLRQLGGYLAGAQVAIA